MTTRILPVHSQGGALLITKGLVRGHYRDVGSKRIYIRPHIACSHSPEHHVKAFARWSRKGKLRPVGLCAHCGHIHSLGKRISKAIPLKSGQRWITIHPHGEDEKGIPVLIQEHPDGSASIVRGAGGKLNYLRLTRLRSKEEWKQSAKENAERRKEARAQREATLSDEERTKEQDFKAELKQTKDLRDTEFVQAVMQAHGVSDDKWKLPEKVLAAMPEKSRALAEKQHLRKMVKTAREMVDQAREDVLAAQDKVIEEALGDLPGETVLPPEPVKGAGAGYVAAVSRKAAENGLTPQELKREKADISWRHFLDAADGNEEAAQAKKESVERLHQALAEVRAPVTAARRAGLLNVEIKPEQPQVADIAKILVADRKHSETEKQLKQVKQEVSDAGLPKAAMLAAKDLAEAAVPEMSDADAREALVQELQEDSMQRAASRILEQADAESGRGALREHLGVGHYDAVNAASLAATQSPCPVDRVTADILGPAASARLLVEHWRRELSPEDLDAVREGIESHHVKRQQAIADDASREYEKLKAEMDGVEIPAVTDADSLMQAQMANDRKSELLMQARRVLGVALGKLEGTAAIVEAFEEGAPKELRVPLGAISNEQAVAQARVLGLAGAGGTVRGFVRTDGGVRAVKSPRKSEPEYQIDSDGANKFLTVSAAGIDKLVSGVDKEFAEKLRVAEEIKSGARDEEGWLPEGIVSRPATTFDDPHERALMVTAPLKLEEGMSAKKLAGALEDYIGARLADGQDPESLRSDLLSAEFVAECVPAGLRGEDSGGPYYKALKDLGFFSYQQVENATGEELAKRAEAIVAKRRQKLGDSANIAALNSQSIPLSESTYEAAHRAMAKVPQAVIIGRGIGEFTPQDKGVLRDYFWSRLTDEKPPVAAETRKQNQEAAERAEEVVGYQHNIFGGVDEVKRGPAEGAEDKPQETAWDRYVRAMGGTDRAYAAIQDLARGEFVTEFAKQLGSITGTEFKTGTKRIAHWDRHVLGLMSPEKQAQLLGDRASAEKRQQAYVATRSGGKFAREEAAGARREKAEELLRRMKQSQMALFRSGKEPGIERVTLGERAEAQLAKVFPMIARNFDPKKPVEIPKDVSMSGKYVLQQRAVKLLEANKRIGLHLGVGSGKSLVSLGAFAHLHSKGKVNRAIFAVPSIVQGQFGCVHGDTELYDPVRNITMSFEEWLLSGLRPFVTSLDGDRPVVKLASRPFIKGVDRMYRVTTDDGSSIVVTGKHRFLTESGWKHLSKLSVGSRVCVGGEPLREETCADDHTSTAGSPAGCRPSAHCDDALPRKAGDICQGAALSRNGALDSSPKYLPSGGRAAAASRNHCVLSFRPSSGLTSRPCGDGCSLSGRCPATSVAVEPRHGQPRWPVDALYRCRRDPVRQDVSVLSRPTHSQAGDCHSSQACAYDAVPWLESCQSNQPSTPVTCPRSHDDAVGLHRLDVPGDQREERLSSQADASGRRLLGGNVPSVGTSMCMIASLTPIGATGRRPIPGKKGDSVVLDQAQSGACVSYGDWPRSGIPSKTGSDLRGSNASVAHRQTASSGAPSAVASNHIVQYTTILSVSEVGVALVFDITVPGTHNYLAHGFWNHNSEALRYFQPGKYRWFANPAASGEERRAAYADPNRHIVVVTHQALRDDLTRALADHKFDGDANRASHWLEHSTEEERKTAIKDAMGKAGWNFDMSVIDEGHDLLNRRGKPNSRMANAIDAMTFNSKYHASMTGDPVKNDSCLHPSTLITDPVRGLAMTVAEWHQRKMRPWVWALDTLGTAHLMQASVPFVKSYGAMFRVVLDSGEEVTVAGNHRFLTPGGWRSLSQLRTGDPIAVASGALAAPKPASHDTRESANAEGQSGIASFVSQGSTSCPCATLTSEHAPLDQTSVGDLPQRSSCGVPRRKVGEASGGGQSTHRACVGRSSRRAPGSTDRCLRDSGLGGARPLRDAGTGLLPAPSQADVPECTPRGLHLDARQALSPTHNPQATRLARRSSEGASHPCATRNANRASGCAQSRCGGKTARPLPGTLRNDQRSPVESLPVLPSRRSDPYEDQERCLSASHPSRGSECRCPGNTASGSSLQLPVPRRRDQSTSDQRHARGCTHRAAVARLRPVSGAAGVVCRECGSRTGRLPDGLQASARSSGKRYLGSPIPESVRHAERVCLPSRYITSAIVYRTIVLIDKVGHDAVYDLTVPIYHNYLAQGMWHHNSEGFSLLHKLDPKRYSDPEAFHAKYGVDTAASAVALQQEMSPYTITGRIRPEVSAPRIVREHDLHPEQQSQYREVLANYRKATQARRAGKVDVDAVRALAPHAFKGLSEEQAREKASQLSQFLSSTRDMALDRVVNTGHIDADVSNAPCAKLDDLVGYVKGKKTGDGAQAPGIVFAHSRAAVKRVKSELGKRGLKVLTLTGEHTSADKEKNKLAFQGGHSDVIVMSDAGAVGANLQRAHWVYQYDTPDTAKTHEQRIGRMERIGQMNPNIEAVDAVSKTPYEARRRKRLATKNELREIFTSPTEMLDDTGLAHEIWRAKQKRLQRDMLPQAAG